MNVGGTAMLFLELRLLAYIQVYYIYISRLLISEKVSAGELMTIIPGLGHRSYNSYSTKYKNSYSY